MKSLGILLAASLLFSPMVRADEVYLTIPHSIQIINSAIQGEIFYPEESVGVGVHGTIAETAQEVMPGEYIAAFNADTQDLLGVFYCDGTPLTQYEGLLGKTQFSTDNFVSPIPYEEFLDARKALYEEITQEDPLIFDYDGDGYLYYTYTGSLEEVNEVILRTKDVDMRQVTNTLEEALLLRGDYIIEIDAYTKGIATRVYDMQGDQMNYFQLDCGMPVRVFYE